MKVFISYRRSDSQDVAGRLYDHLERRLGTQAIFKDTESIAIGSNFAERIRATLQETDVMLVVIGPTWISAQDKALGAALMIRLIGSGRKSNWRSPPM